jgi:hypothetical protein
MRPARAAFAGANSTFAASDRPPVACTRNCSMNGVTALPLMCSACAAASACSMNPATSSASRANASGMGLATSIPPPSPSAHFALAIAATSSGVSTRASTGRPLVRVKNAGNSSVPYPSTGTPSVSSTSSVRGRSRMLFAPADTTITSVRANSCRSAETSMVCSTPRCTPPMPPVPNTRMPASAAPIIVDATVVAPS